MSRPRLLDLFCGAGGAAMGYSERELAWAAGFFDGEGSVSPRFDRRPGRRPSVQLEIEQTDIRPLERFQRALGHGGNITQRKARAATRKPLWRLHYYGNAAMDVAEALYPYLCEPKRAQIRRTMEAVDAAA